MPVMIAIAPATMPRSRPAARQPRSRERARTIRVSLGPVMDKTGLLRLLGRPASDVHALFRCGSRVYGTATATSDEDFVAVLARRDARQDLLFRDGVNVVIHGLDTFREAIAGQSVFALE